MVEIGLVHAARPQGVALQVQRLGAVGLRDAGVAEGPGAPALAYVNPQPRLPHSEATPPEQPETFMRRARRVRLGSSRLKLWYLALCTFGRAWTRGEDVLEIGIKQQSLAGELETTRKRVVLVLSELRDTGLVHVSRSKYHSVIRIFLTPQEGVPDDPERGSSNVFRSLLDVQQQQQQPRAGAREATEKQLSGIISMAAELGVPAPQPQDRLEADVVFRELRERVAAQRSGRRQDKRRPAPTRRRHRIVAALSAGGKCEVCGEHRPDPKGTCPGER